MSKGSIYVSNSANSKLAGKYIVDATYASINNTCPDTCSLKDNGCYAQLGYTAITSNRLDKEAEGMSTLSLAREEAKAIDNSYKGEQVPRKRFLRLHVSGDSRTVKGSKLINSAVGRWIKRGGAGCWSYTHAWKGIKRSIWSNVSMLASVSSVKEAKQASSLGYVPALVVKRHISNKVYKLKNSNIKWIPCPNQTMGTGCSDCKLCLNHNYLYNNNYGIAFAAHGTKKKSLKKHLTVLQ